MGGITTPFQCLIHAPFRAASSSLLVLCTPLYLHWQRNSVWLSTTHTPYASLDERLRLIPSRQRRLLLLARLGALLEGALPLR
ncbi:hypothetical protein M441DRAFT_290477 [Trichoderma asperellum CBS 433.97]|uniref:Uncharacterized protein n=1 Tax=Trichoderma asperellum (strain ATCC 204424 / CBS 433.97 / NBRC 101777) TaxID=1042311 RepID=A0A2T3YTX6_TRIA4|nr:hypothetical protein M441DRAFT_290477 [Trichoderma asperellum CBS 433.97]PTB36015.1 hypothetical protein M441DRAFT_290477 [Trichoderma asperellum CBS 433.97]